MILIPNIALPPTFNINVNDPNFDRKNFPCFIVLHCSVSYMARILLAPNFNLRLRTLAGQVGVVKNFSSTFPDKKKYRIPVDKIIPGR
jgi:hypothetical protein